MDFINATRFQGSLLVTSDREGADCLGVLAKATFAISDDGELELAEEQLEIALADAFHGEPDVTSLLQASDLAVGKPGTDLVLQGTVSPIDRKYVVDVLFQVGAQHKRVRVFGDRYWDKVIGISRMTDPRPFPEMPLLWERSFGGADLSSDNPKHHEFEARNPVGIGFRAKHSKLPVPESPLPNLEDPADLIGKPGDRPAPTGFGYVCRHWSPRKEFAGTYDETWQESRCPLLPNDFDLRYHDRGPAGMIAESVPPGTPVRVVHAGSRPEIKTTVPSTNTRAEFLFRNGRSEIPLHLDTVLVNADVPQLILTWSGFERVQGRVDSIVSAILRSDWKAP